VDKRIRGLVIVSGGFADAGEQGRARLAEVVRRARDAGARLIGPNAMGLVNTVVPVDRLEEAFWSASVPPAQSPALNFGQAAARLSC